jgi:hypothetical protein
VFSINLQPVVALKSRHLLLMFYISLEAAAIYYTLFVSTGASGRTSPKESQHAL